MAIQSNYTQAYNQTAVFKKNGQPPPFRATRKGLNVAHPHFPATEHNSNALLYQSIAQPPSSKPYLQNMWMFVNNIQTGWNLSGNTTQAQTSRNFYPNYLTQDDLIISGTMANQYEYDKLTEFVEYHQNYLFQFANQDKAGILVGGIQIPAIYFSMFKPITQHSFNFVEGFSIGNNKGIPEGVNIKSGNNTISYALVITQMQAGHEQFVFSPAFTLTCKVVDDFRQPNSEISFDIMANLTNYQVIFGDYSNPVGVISNPPGPTTSDTPASSTAQAGDFPTSGSYSSPDYTE